MAEFIYIEVLKNGSKGLWELNINQGKALFRDWDHKREKDDERVHDWHEVYTTIQQYLQEEMKIQNIKEIIPDVKYLFSNEYEFCSHYDVGLSPHDPNQKKQCMKPATIYRNREPVCNEHGHLAF